jgi:hypothetical protein
LKPAVTRFSTVVICGELEFGSEVSVVADMEVRPVGIAAGCRDRGAPGERAGETQMHSPETECFGTRNIADVRSKDRFVANAPGSGDDASSLIIVVIKLGFGIEQQALPRADAQGTGGRAAQTKQIIEAEFGAPE